MSAAITNAGGFSSDRFSCQCHVEGEVRLVFHRRPEPSLLLSLPELINGHTCLNGIVKWT